MKIWQRYIFFQIAKTFLFILIAIFTIYILVDLSINGVQLLFDEGVLFSDAALYYSRQFAMHLELFLPLTLLFTTLRVLFDLNMHREWAALQAAGLSSKKLLLPFFFFASLLTAICYINSQWFAPDALDEASAFKYQHLKKKKKRSPVFTLSLSDDSELIYQHYDPKKKELSDVFWIKTPNDIWHFKILEIPHMNARFADHFIQKDQLIKNNSFDTITLTDLPWDPNASLSRFVPFENRPISTLFSQAKTASSAKAGIFSHLYYKLALPLLSFLILFAISPIALRFSRNLSPFLIAACSLFGFIALKTILDGMLILGENQVLPASFAIWSPLILLFALSLRPFLRL
ncbi:MAG: hypothetical protein A3E80_02530 [Chlamydiae bacterium RIFCSPHIGHO2_12_FULL_49_9]|nr:MAG: hypothetical protein A3E80_02530 [Chlamydiae bacterium RIFCSPHIGHO2_12_FULL_49_9]